MADLRRLVVTLLWCAACAPPRAASPPPATPVHVEPVPPAAPAVPPAPIEVPLVDGPLRLQVVHPPPGTVLDVRDSTFLLGSTGTGRATLAINGAPVRVWPNGAWLAWVAVPPGDTIRFDLVARAGDAVAAQSLRARRPAGTLVRGDLAVDGHRLAPAGRLWVAPGDRLRFEALASPGAHARLRLPDGQVVDLLEQPADDVPAAVRAFAREAGTGPSRRRARYVAELPARTIGADPGPVLAPAAAGADAAAPELEVVRGADTLRLPWPLRVGLLPADGVEIRLDDDSAGQGRTDSVTVGRALPGATYHWFLPTGTRATLDRRHDDDVRLRLGGGETAWVAAADVQGLAPGLPPASARAGSITIRSAPDRAVLRLPLGERVPVRVLDRDDGVRLQLYRTRADIDWIRYPAADTLIRRVDWQQAGELLEVEVRLDRPLWGWRTRWEGTDLLVEIRRPPAVDERHPLRGRVILLDAGHPPAGATGPTGYREAEANLAIARRLRALLEADGAIVRMTRDDDRALDLWPRVRQADTSDAEVLVSIHNNALPDGVNPFENHGTTVFYNHAPSVPLARAVQAALVARLGYPDLGIGRGDLALVRPTWLPSILTEGAFMILPEQEAALRSPEGQVRYASGVRDGLLAFLRGVALTQR